MRPVAKGEMLGPMLEAGEIDALISAVVPRCILQGSDKVGRLFPGYETVERDYFARTEIFPIMHTVVIRKDVLAAHPSHRPINLRRVRQIQGVGCGRISQRV